MPATIATVLERLASLDDDFEVYSAEDDPPPLARIAAVEKKLGVPLRADHKQLMAALGCGAVLASAHVWPRPAELDVRPAWQFVFGVEFFGVAKGETAPPLDVVLQSKQRKGAGKTKLVAALHRVSEPSCVGYDAAGKLYEWSRGEEPVPYAKRSLFDVLLEWLRTLEDDKDRMKEAGAAKKPARSRADRGAGGGAPAASVEHWLGRLLTDDDNQDEAGDALIATQPALVPKVVAALVRKATAKEPNDDAIWALAYLEKNKGAVDALLGLATHRNAEVRATALGVIGALEGKPKRAVAVLVAGLGDRDEDARAEAADALGAYAPASAISAMIDALVKEQRRSGWDSRILAAHLFTALGAAGPGRKEVIAVLAKNLQPKNRYAALPVYDALIAMGKRAARAVPALEAVVAGSDSYLSTLARHALISITGDAKPHLGALRAATKNKEPGGAVAAVAKRALQGL